MIYDVPLDKKTRRYTSIQELRKHCYQCQQNMYTQWTRDYTGCGSKTWWFLSSVTLAIVWGVVMQPRSAGSWLHAISVAME